MIIKKLHTISHDRFITYGSAEWPSRVAKILNTRCENSKYSVSQLTIVIFSPVIWSYLNWSQDLAKFEKFYVAFCSTLTHCVTSYGSIGRDTDNDLLPDGTKLLPESILTYPLRCSMAFTCEQFTSGAHESNSSRMSHAYMCQWKKTIIGSDNGLSPVIWTNVGVLLIKALETKFNEILIEIATVSLNKMHFVCNMAAISSRPQWVNPRYCIA